MCWKHTRVHQQCSAGCLESAHASLNNTDSSKSGFSKVNLKICICVTCLTSAVRCLLFPSVKREPGGDCHRSELIHTSICDSFFPFPPQQSFLPTMPQDMTAQARTWDVMRRLHWYGECCCLAGEGIPWVWRMKLFQMGGQTHSSARVIHGKPGFAVTVCVGDAPKDTQCCSVCSCSPSLRGHKGNTNRV